MISASQAEAGQIKNWNFTSSNTGAAYLLLPQSVSLFVLLYDFGF